MFVQTNNERPSVPDRSRPNDYSINLSTTQLPLIAYGLVNSAVANILNELSCRFFELAFQPLNCQLETQGAEEEANSSADDGDAILDFSNTAPADLCQSSLVTKPEQIENFYHEMTTCNFSVPTYAVNHSAEPTDVEVHADLDILRDHIIKVDEGDSSLPQQPSSDEDYREESRNSDASTSGEYSSSYNETSRINTASSSIKKTRGLKRRNLSSSDVEFSDLNTKRPYASSTFRYECPYPGCDLSLTNKANWMRHVKKVHRNEGSYVCSYPDCDRRFESSEKLSNHIHVHFVERTFECDYPNCGKKFPRKSNLRSHQLTHTKNGPSFNPQGFIRVDMSKGVEFPFTCLDPGCGAQFRFRSEAEDHAHQHPHWPKRSVYRCPEEGCNTVFFAKASVKKHMVTVHEERRPHVCNYPNCGRRFHETSGLAVHMRIHTGERPYICSFIGCNRTFRQKCNLKSHEKSHQVREYSALDDSKS